MAENGVLELKRPRRSLFLGDNVKKKGSKKQPRTEAKQASPPASIVSFFTKASPAQVVCPLCGQTVPRYTINQHMDEVCQKSCNAGDDDVIFVPSASDGGVAGTLSGSQQDCSSPCFTKDTSTPEQPPNPPEGSGLKRKRGAGEQASPYFKEGGNLSSSNSYPTVREVENISLGSLSSKLSRRRCAQGGGVARKHADTCRTADEWNNAVERNLEEDATPETGGSQKENCFPFSGFVEQSDPKARLTSTAGTLSVAPDRDPGVLQVGSEDSTRMSIPWGDLDCNGHVFPSAGGSERPESWIDPTPDPRQRATCATAPSEAEPPSQSFLLPPAKLMPFKQDQEFASCGNHTIQLPTEDCQELRDESAGDCARSSKKPTLVATSGTVFGTLTSPSGSAAELGGQPYYLQNFLRVMRAVLEDSDDVRLFDEHDLLLISKFYKLSARGQQLYVRLFQRKLSWIKTSRLNYPEIADDLSSYIEELVETGFLEPESDLQDLSEVLTLLSAPDLRILAQIFHLKNPNLPKQKLLADFHKLARQRSIFSSEGSGIGRLILKRAKDLAGKSIRVWKGPRDVFSRVLLLFNLAEPAEDEEAGSGGQKALSTMLLVDLGRTIFPTYTVRREHLIFLDRDDFLRYASAAHASSDISMAMTSRDWEEALRLYKVAKDVWQRLQAHPSLRHHAALPEYLRCFTVGWVYTRILSQGVEILQRLHMYKGAVEQLEDLLAQEIYCTDSRGRWWDRLALNLHQHLKDIEKAIDYIRKGLLDPSVRTGHRLALSQRAQWIKDSPSCKNLRHLLQDLPFISVEDVSHVTIKGKLCPQTGMGKSVFIMKDLGPEGGGEDDQLSTAVCSVEELALAHYKHKGFDEGIHGEGSTFSTLYGLLMWDILFMDGIPDAFRSLYQASPLDLYTDSFYENRKEAIDSRLRWLHDAPPETLAEWIGGVWNAQKGKAAALVSWERFSSLQQAQSLVCCLGGAFLSGICRRLSRDLRHCRAGLPDLVVWRTDDRQFKLVEVKGPSDRLSPKQMLWLAELQRLGAVVEVCHVVATGSKSDHLS